MDMYPWICFHILNMKQGPVFPSGSVPHLPRFEGGLYGSKVTKQPSTSRTTPDSKRKGGKTAQPASSTGHRRSKKTEYRSQVFIRDFVVSRFNYGGLRGLTIYYVF